MNCDAVNDYRLRHDLFDLYNALWGTVTPACVPNHGFGVVIDLKEKKAVSNAALTNFLPASPELNASVSAGEEQPGMTFPVCFVDPLTLEVEQNVSLVCLLVTAPT